MQPDAVKPDRCAHKRSGEQSVPDTAPPAVLSRAEPPILHDTVELADIDEPAGSDAT